MAIMAGSVNSPAKTAITMSRAKSTRGAEFVPECRRHRLCHAARLRMTNSPGCRTRLSAPAAIVANGTEGVLWAEDGAVAEALTASSAMNNTGRETLRIVVKVRSPDCSMILDAPRGLFQTISRSD